MRIEPGPSWRPVLSLIAASLFAALIAGIPPAAHASGEADAARSRAYELASTGRCADALPLLADLREAHPQDAELADLAGKCQIETRRWEDATASFAEAKRLDPETPSVDLHLAVARFHAGDLDGAGRALDDARVRSPASAEVDLYDGLIRLERAEEPTAAAESLERARGRDPVGVEPVASYFAGIAWLRAEEKERAREALERVKLESPGTAWADAAERALTDSDSVRGLRVRRDLSALQNAERPLGSFSGQHRTVRPWVVVSAGVEHDSNVLLRGDGVRVPDEISDENDIRAVWTAQIGSELWSNRDWTIGAMASYYGSAHSDLTDFDTHYPSATVWIDRRLTEATLLRLQYDFSYAWVGKSPYLREHALTPALFHNWGERWGTTRVYAELRHDDFRFSPDDEPDGFPGGSPGDDCPDTSQPCGPFGVDESDERNRDGFWGIFGFDHAFPVDAIASELRFGYAYHYYDAEGSEYSFRGHELSVGTRTALPWRFVADVQGSFTYRPYENPSTFPDSGALTVNQQFGLRSRDKRERIWRVDAILERPLNRWLTASVRYGYQNNDANVAVFDFDRHIIGGYLTFAYQR